MPTAKPILLIVEDSKTEQYVLRELLRRFDYDAHIVSTGEKALKATGVTSYAAVLMDLKLPGMDGYECARRIRQAELASGRRTPIIALTATAKSSGIGEAIAVGMDDYLSKPFEPDDLRKMLLRHVYIPDQPNLKVLQPVTDEPPADESIQPDGH